ncbi:MAG: hypothetical protein HYU86_01800 [Chloroflexi bacterium]|nr:hypothetical protein [Chloroflexota bacterium]
MVLGEESSPTAGAGGALATLFFTLALVPALLVYNLFLLTSPPVAQPLAAFVIGEVSQIDGVVAQVRTQLESSPRPEDPFLVPDFPLEVWLEPQEAASKTPIQLRDYILHEAAGGVYQGRLSSPSGRDAVASKNPVFWSLAGILSYQGHRFLGRVLLWVSAVAAFLGLAVIVLEPGWGKSLGVGFTLASFPLLALSVLGGWRVAALAQGQEDAFLAAMLKAVSIILYHTGWNYLLFLGLGVGLYLVGYLAPRWRLR